MKKLIFVYVCCAILLFVNAFAEADLSDHFAIRCDLDSRYAQFILKNAEAYYENLQAQYFQNPWPKPLIIYYSETQSDTQRLLKSKGYENTAEHGFYEPDTPAVYTHRFMDNGQLNTWDGLFREVTHHFIHLDYKNPPEWFDEGLACFLGEQTQIADGKPAVGRPSPLREQILRSKIEQGHRLNIRRLLSSSEEQFGDWDLGCHFARAFFYWLYETNQLKKYLKTVRGKGYELPTLEETLSMSYGEINVELLKFIKNDCYAGAYLKDGQDTEGNAQKIQSFKKALELKPDYQLARLELAECYYREGNYKSCRENLELILKDPQGVEYRRAACLMAGTYYDEKEYSKALEYYNKAWEHSDYYEYKYRLAYKIGNCLYHMQDHECAKRWYKEFLDCKWEQDAMKSGEAYARKYIECVDAAANTARHKSGKIVRNKNEDKK